MKMEMMTKVSMMLIIACFSICQANDAALYPSLFFPSHHAPAIASLTCQNEFPICYQDDNLCSTCESTCPSSDDDAGSGDDGYGGDVFQNILTSIPQAECSCPNGFSLPTLASTSCCNETDTCTSRINDNAHPVQYAFDGEEATYWQSPSSTLRIDVTFDLRATMEISEISATFATRRPKTMIIQKSLDGKMYSDYQYFALDCENSFGMTSDETPQSSEDVVCVTTESSASGNIVRFSPLDTRRPPIGSSRDFNRNPGLQRFARARYIKFLLRAYHDEDSAQTPFGDPLDIAPFYAIREIKVQARCFCNGHANTCPFINDMDPDSPRMCDCQHNTEGDLCERCEPLFNRKPWKSGIEEEGNPCLACDCNDHALSCYYDAQFDEYPDERDRGDGGVCDNCMHNTAGQHCETCLTGYFENSLTNRSAVDACLPCGCDLDGTENGLSVCNIETGQCTCKRNVEGRACDKCKPGSFGLSDLDRDGCRLCNCDTLGTINGTFVCDDITGQCPCKPGYLGRDCGDCETGAFRAGGQGVCTACDAQCGDLGCIAAGPRKGSACLNCANVEYEGICIASCPQDTYISGDICLPCHSQCSGGCFGPGPNQCNACLNFKNNETCVDSCPALTFSRTDRICHSCNEQCSLGCSGPTATDCTQCLNAKDGVECVDTCPSNKYRDLSGICNPCHVQCDGCSAQGPFACHACQIFNRTNPDNGLTECVASCQALEFANDGVCTACHAQCAEGCTGPSNTDCVGKCTSFTFGDACVSTCPPDTFSTSSQVCQTCHPQCAGQGCVGPLDTQCISCSNDSVVIISGNTQRCADKCPDGSYPDSENICKQCDSNCEKCYGPDPDQCTECTSLVNGEVCVSNCPSFHFRQLLDGNTTQGGISSPASCTICNSQCLSGCTGPEPDDCLDCKVARLNGVCVDQCPADSMFNNNGVCQTCHAQCKDGCTGPLPSQCTACKNFFDPESGCVASCPVTKYVNGATRECEACSSQCSTVDAGCFGPGSNQCRSCRNFFDRSSASCVTSCPSDTYANTARECISCHPLCDGCTGPSATDCISCLSASLSGLCIDSCPSLTHFLDKDGICVRCNSQCDGPCSQAGPSRCIPTERSSTGCRNYLFDDTCVASCPAGTFPVGDPGINAVCESCHETCETCDGSSASDCTSCSDSTFLEQGQCKTCHPQCSEGGCSGSTNKDCLFGCKSFTNYLSSTPECLTACPSNSFVSNTPVPRSCKACSSQCSVNDGCTGPTASDCGSCKSVSFQGNCVTSCPKGTSADDNDNCQPCHSQCADECTSPNDATSCVRCRTFALDTGECVSSCPESHPLYFNGQCLTECPGQYPYHNDTSGSSKFIPAECLASCLQLNDPARVYVTTDQPFTCTTKGSAEGSNNDDGGIDETVWIVLGAAVAITVTVAILLLIIRHQRKTASVSISDEQYNLSATRMKPTTTNAFDDTSSSLYDQRLDSNSGVHNTYMELQSQPNRPERPASSYQL